MDDSFVNGSPTSSSRTTPVLDFSLPATPSDILELSPRTIPDQSENKGEESTLPSDNGKLLTRKRKVDKGNWRDCKAKNSRNCGVIGEKRNGFLINPREMKEGCANSCRFQCQNRLTREDRQAAFSMFWKLGDHVRQWHCISEWITSEPPVVQKNLLDIDEDARRKLQVHKYQLPSGEGLVKVCRKMFLDSLDISQQWIKTVDNKVREGNGLLSGQSDNRGKHLNRPKRVPNIVKNTARDHIKSFPVMESHYCRQNSNRGYLEEGLTITKMFRLYKEDMKHKNLKTVVSFDMYRRIFNDEFNYSFFKPKKDRCGKCEAFSNLSDAEQISAREEHNLHIINKQAARDSMRADKAQAMTDDSLCVINVDLQKVLTTPRAEIGPLYYSSKLNVYNFTIFELASHVGVCNVWNETIGCRGSNEIASMLYKFFCYKKDSATKNYIIYSDNCGGQNRNKTVFGMYIYAAHLLKINITHRFLEGGHTQCAGDSMHALIERRSHQKSIFTQKQWCDVMQGAKITLPYLVNEIKQEEILDFTNFASLFNWQNAKIASIKEISVLHGLKFIHAKYDFQQEAKEVEIKKKDASWEDLMRYSLRPAYEGKIHLPEKKQRDLQQLIEKRLIPNEYHAFYKTLFNI